MSIDAVDRRCVCEQYSAPQLQLDDVLRLLKRVDVESSATLRRCRDERDAEFASSVAALHADTTRAVEELEGLARSEVAP